MGSPASAIAKIIIAIIRATQDTVTTILVIGSCKI